MLARYLSKINIMNYIKKVLVFFSFCILFSCQEDDSVVIYNEDSFYIFIADSCNAVPDSLNFTSEVSLGKITLDTKFKLEREDVDFKRSYIQYEYAEIDGVKVFIPYPNKINITRCLNINMEFSDLTHTKTAKFDSVTFWYYLVYLNGDKDPNNGRTTIEVNNK